MSNQLDITADQALATQRADLRGVVYLLSGTLPGNVRSDDEVFYWSTQTVSGLGQNFDAMLGAPVAIQREASFDPRTGPSSPAVRIPIRNLPFSYSHSILATLIDDHQQWEGTTATLRVGYLKPGQAPEDLVDADWTPLVLDGYLGSPQDITLDGFSIVLYNRGAKRNQSVSQRRVTTNTTSSSSQGVDKVDVGQPWPIVIGRPDTWFRLPTTIMRVRGFLVSGYASGATTIQARPITSGTNFLKTSGSPNGSKVIIHTRTPVYGLTSSLGDVTYDEDLNLLTWILAAPGLQADVPRGAYFQEFRSAGYQWALGDFKLLNDSADLEGSVGLLTSDGRVTVVDPGRWPFSIKTIADATSYGGTRTELLLAGGSQADPNVPAFFDPAVGGTPASVSTQPEFTSNLFLSSQIAYPSSATGGTDPSNAVDGNENTPSEQADGVTMVVTFSQTPPSPFGVNDTTNSVLHAIIQGSPLFRNNDATQIYGSFAVGTGTNYKVRMVIGAGPEPFDENVRVTGDGATSFVTNIWWEHDLETTQASTRDTDVAVTGGGGGGAEILEYADLVFRMPKNISGTTLLENAISGGSLVASPWLATETARGETLQPIAHPTAAFAGLQGLLLGGTEGGLETIAQDAYDAAHSRFQAENIRWNFALTELVRSWTELEQELAAQSRSDFYYGPSGHEIVFQESISGLASAPVLQEFTLEGAPGANAVQGSGPLMTRTGVSEIRNTVVVDYAPDLVESGKFQASQEQQQSDSVTLFGEQTDPRGRFGFWAHSADTGNTNYSVDGSVSGIATHMAERFAFARMRYNFRTAWIAHGLDRGSLVSVNFKVSPNQFRTHRCEVERIRTSPLPDELVEITCRSVGAAPAQGLAAATSGLLSSVDFDGSANSVLRSDTATVGIADVWSVGVWWRPDDVSFTKEQIVWNIKPSNNVNNIACRFRADHAIRMELYNGAGVNFKRYDWGGILLRDAWNFLMVTWSGTDLKLYLNGLERAPSATPTDDADSQTDATERRIGLGNRPSHSDTNAAGAFYTLGIWDSVLTSGAQVALWNGGNGVNAQFDTIIGDYSAGANLQHWHRPGFDTANIGKDYGVATAMPLLLAGTFMHAARIGRNAPDAAPVFGPEFSLKLDGSTNTILHAASGVLGVANTWSVGLWYKPDAVAFSQGQVLWNFRESSNDNRLLCRFLSNQNYRVAMSDSAGVGIKTYDFPGGAVQDEWVLIMTTWNGIDLKLYMNGIQIAPDIIADDAGTMTDSSRQMGLGVDPKNGGSNAAGVFYTLGLWDVTLTSGAQFDLYNEGNGRDAPFGTDMGTYASSANLQHWHRPGFGANIGKDYGIAGAGALPLELNGGAYPLIVRDAPTG